MSLNIEAFCEDHETVKTFNNVVLMWPQRATASWVYRSEGWCCTQGCHSHKRSKFPDFSLTYIHFSLTNQTYKNEDMYVKV